MIGTLYMNLVQYNNTASVTVNTILYKSDIFAWLFVCLYFCQDKFGILVSLYTSRCGAKHGPRVPEIAHNQRR